ncbi:hypothetical protein O6H91_02G127200 [Diphasiastrum complanatum]|uniref:Uncharacterized protein n=1 Tax=Diphasiastrum complanatum TaxID=34168 RepID=A0ACC2EKN4_DIPCM|nr:hypothetical protein O6H91_02G127200 [Diphasiastrum complanatum]
MHISDHPAAAASFFKMFDFTHKLSMIIDHIAIHNNIRTRGVTVSVLLAVSTAILILACNATFKLLRYYCLQPWALVRALQAQGLKGPVPRFLLGNISQIVETRNEMEVYDMEIGDHNILSRICPYYCQWSAEYGKTFVFWWGTEPRIPATDSEILKEILFTKSEYFGKSSIQLKGGVLLLGNGLIFANGTDWAKRRQIIAPAFHIEKLKEMVPLIVNCTSQMLRTWDQVLKTTEGSVEMDVCEQFAGLTSDVIVQTAFGSCCFNNGKKVFQLLKSLERIYTEYNRRIWLPGCRFLPTPLNREASRLQQEMQGSLKAIIEARNKCDNECSSRTNDLLGLLLAESNKNHIYSTEQKFGAKELVEECRTFFFVGHETTYLLLTWTIMLLALHPYWQEQARAEVMEVFKGRDPQADLLNKLKIVGMIFNESLRLYPPAPTLLRTALSDVQVGSLHVPKGTTFWIPILAIHHDPTLWGADANEFKPERFSESLGNSSRHLLSFLPFSSGPRICVGQTFALTEAKVVLVMLLQNYKFWVSPKYRHAPTSMITLKPKYGMPMIIEKV